MIKNKNIENPSQKLILLFDNMFDYIVRLLVSVVDGGAKVSQHPVHGYRNMMETITYFKKRNFLEVEIKHNKTFQCHMIWSAIFLRTGRVSFRILF